MFQNHCHRHHSCVYYSEKKVLKRVFEKIYSSCPHRVTKMNKIYGRNWFLKSINWYVIIEWMKINTYWKSFSMLLQNEDVRWQNESRWRWKKYYKTNFLWKDLFKPVRTFLAWIIYIKCCVGNKLFLFKRLSHGKWMIILNKKMLLKQTFSCSRKMVVDEWTGSLWVFICFEIDHILNPYT